MATNYKVEAQRILESRKNANFLVDLLEKLDSSDESELIELISCLETVFNGYFSQKLWKEQFNPDEGLGDGVTEELLHGMKDDKNVKDEDNKELSGVAVKKNAERVFAEWAHAKYLHFVRALLQLLSRQEKRVQKSALSSLMNFLVADYNATVSSPKYKKAQLYFPNTLFSRIMDRILFCGPKATKTQLKNFEAYLKFADIRFYTLRNINRIANGKSKSISKNEGVKNVLCSLLIRMSLNQELDQTKGFVIDDEDKLQTISEESKERKKLLNNTWLSFLRLKLPVESLKKVLANLHENIMPQLEDPKLLIDFLTDSYNLEGPMALLALNGLFILIQNYNLDYPDFFKKLYSLLDVEAFEVEYRDRFFALADLFLTSLNLPAYMAAAFIKRLARLSLRVSPDGIKIILVMIENLIKRHPSCKVLLHRKVCTLRFFFNLRSVEPTENM